MTTLWSVCGISVQFMAKLNNAIDRKGNAKNTQYKSASSESRKCKKNAKKMQKQIGNAKKIQKNAKTNAKKMQKKCKKLEENHQNCKNSSHPGKDTKSAKKTVENWTGPGPGALGAQ